jgi:hypothetical protein
MRSLGVALCVGAMALSGASIAQAGSVQITPGLGANTGGGQGQVTPGLGSNTGGKGKQKKVSAGQGGTLGSGLSGGVAGGMGGVGGISGGVAGNGVTGGVPHHHRRGRHHSKLFKITPGVSVSPVLSPAGQTHR